MHVGVGTRYDALCLYGYTVVVVHCGGCICLQSFCVWLVVVVRCGGVRVVVVLLFRRVFACLVRLVLHVLLLHGVAVGWWDGPMGGWVLRVPVPHWRHHYCYCCFVGVVWCDRWCCGLWCLPACGGNVWWWWLMSHPRPRPIPPGESAIWRSGEAVGWVGFGAFASGRRGAYFALKFHAAP